MFGNDGGGGEEMVRGPDGRSFQRRGAVLDNDSAIIIISLPVLLISAKGVYDGGHSRFIEILTTIQLPAIP